MERVYWCNACGHPAKYKRCEKCGADCLEVEIPDSMQE